MLRSPTNRDEMYVDIGVYGVPQQERFDPEKTTRKLEEFVRHVGGFKMLYADSYMTREEFRAMFDHSIYDRFVKYVSDSHFLPMYFRVREKVGCKGNFPEVYDKVNRRSRSGPFRDFQNKWKKKFEKFVD